MLYSRFEFLRLLQVRGADIIQPDICVVGGVLEMMKIDALAEAHYVTIAPHNPMGPLATAVNLHFCAAASNFRFLEYRLPHGPGYVFGTGAASEAPSSDQRLQGAWYVKDPYLPKDGYLELRPERPGWGVEMDRRSSARRTTSTGSARCRSSPTARRPTSETAGPKMPHDPKTLVPRNACHAGATG